LARPAAWTPSFDRILQLFEQASIETFVVDDVRSVIWSKLVINAGINPLTALLRVANGFLVENDLARQLMREAVEEAAQIARAQGISLDYTDAGQRALEVAQATAGNNSSMLQDVLRGAPTEIEAITGVIVKLGGGLHVPTPVNALLLRLMRAGAAKIEAADLQRLLS
jgi:2-dehydropantoate 2-reductase